jgi:sulfite oxidase
MTDEKKRDHSTTTTRRTLLKSSALAGAALGLGTPLAPSTLAPGERARRAFEIARARAADDPLALYDKDPRLVVLGDRPLNAETPAHLLDDDTTSSRLLFVRNNGLVPENIDPATWTLTVEGEAVEKSLTFTLDELKAMPRVTRSFVLECGGNGRAEFNPPTPGNQWTTGGQGCPTWTGVPLKHILKKAGVKKTAVYIGYVGKDPHLTRDPNKHSISRGVPIAKALDDDTIVAFAMNGADIPLVHGHPLRLVAPGFPASVSGKWLAKILVRDRVHDGAKMEGQTYRTPCEPVRPGAVVADDAMCIIEEMPVKSLITRPMSGIVHDGKGPLEVSGHAWSGHKGGLIKEVAVSIDYGATWQKAVVGKPRNRFDWQRFTTKITFPKKGYYEVWARATDARGVTQPMVSGEWNPQGYAGNATHRIAVQVT